MGLQDNTIHILKREDFFRPGEYVQIQLSNEYPDYVGVLHRHKFIEMVYIISGTATHYIEGKTSPVKRGDLFIINMDTPHAFEPDTNTGEPFIAYDLMFTPEFFDQSITGYNSLETLNDSFILYSLFQGQQTYRPYFSVSGSNFTIFGELFNKIYLEHREQRTGYLEIIRAYLLQLLVLTFRMEEGAKKKAAANPQTVRYLLDFIHNNYNRHISVQELADKVYLSKDYLSRHFRDTTGMTITAMIQKVRIENACRLLSTTDRTIADIADACGFEDMTFFYSVFKKHMGLPPGDYRKHTRAHGKTE